MSEITALAVCRLKDLSQLGGGKMKEVFPLTQLGDILSPSPSVKGPKYYYNINLLVVGRYKRYFRRRSQLRQQYLLTR